MIIFTHLGVFSEVGWCVGDWLGVVSSLARSSSLGIRVLAVGIYSGSSGLLGGLGLRHIYLVDMC